LPLRVEDIITHIGDYIIDNAGMVHGEGDRLIKFKYLVQRLAHDGKLSLTIMRDNLEQQLEVPVRPDLHRWLFPALVLERLSYFIYGPLVFTEATDDYVRSVSDESNVLGLISSRNLIYARYGDLRSFPDEHIVIVAYPIFTHKMGKAYEDPYTHAVAKVNGVHIHNLKHFVKVLRDATDEFTEFTFHGNFTDEIVFKHTEALT
jgi:PDZ domain